MNSPLRISVVSYLNSKPFIYGLQKYGFDKKAIVELDIPSVCAERLISGQADIGLVPVAPLARLSTYHIISDYCIGANGEVSSVLLLSEVPLEKIDKILLDYQSRTSVNLARVLAKELWKISPKWEDTSSDYEKKISNQTAGVVIGDRALLLGKSFPYVYDLSAEWKKLTGLPFVFACWVATSDPGKLFVDEFNSALQSGLSMIEEISDKEQDERFSSKTIHTYLTRYIDYKFDDQKKQALKLFLSYLESGNTESKS